MNSSQLLVNLMKAAVDAIPGVVDSFPIQIKESFLRATGEQLAVKVRDALLGGLKWPPFPGDGREFELVVPEGAPSVNGEARARFVLLRIEALPRETGFKRKLFLEGVIRKAGYRFPCRAWGDVFLSTFLCDYDSRRFFLPPGDEKEGVERIHRYTPQGISWKRSLCFPPFPFWEHYLVQVP